MTIDLNVEFCGITFRNPFILASAPPTLDAKRIHKAAKAGWAGAVTKSVWPERVMADKMPRPNYFIANETPFVRRPPTMFAFQNIEHILGERWITREMRAAKRTGIPIIGSISGFEPDDWGRLAQMMEEAGADMLELNISCPYIGPKRSQYGLGVEILIGEDPQATAEVVRIVKEACSVPVMAKLPSSVTPSVFTDVAMAAVKAGADALSATNTVLGIIGIDVETGIPLAAVENKQGNPQSILGGISGPALRPIALRCVAQLATSVKVPISGVGGIVDWKSAVEFVMLGAKTVQCGTGPMVYGYGIIKKMIKGLQDFMERRGYKAIEDFRGKSLRFFGPFDNLKLEQPVKAVIDEGKCINCGFCAVACNAGGAGAIKIEGAITIDKKLCKGCGLCATVCPTAAIRLTKLPWKNSTT